MVADTDLRCRDVRIGVGLSLPDACALCGEGPCPGTVSPLPPEGGRGSTFQQRMLEAEAGIEAIRQKLEGMKR